MNVTALKLNLEKLNEVLGLLNGIFEKIQVEQLRDTFKSADIEDMVFFQYQFKSVIESLGYNKTCAQKCYDFIRQQTLPEEMDSRNVSNIVANGIRAALSSDLFVSIKSNKKVEAYEWLSDNGYGDVIKETVNASTLKAIVKNRIKKGEEMPEDLFNVTPITIATTSKA